MIFNNQDSGTEIRTSGFRKKDRTVRTAVGRCRYFASVSVFGFLVGFYKSRFGIRYRFLKISDIGSFFRLSNPFL